MALSIVGLALVFSIVSMVVGKITYDKQFPRFARQDDTVTASLRYADLQSNYPRRLVSFASGNNTLQGYLYGENQTRGLVVVVHGLGGGADSYLSQIAYFVDQGWRVFAYDATGSYDSEGKTTKGFPQALLDLDAALKYVNTQPELRALPVLLFGHSWGGYAVANVLHYGHDIAGVVTVSGANSAMDMIMEQGRRIMGRFINTQRPFIWLYQKMLFGEAASLNAVDTINRANVPVLIVHGTEDDMVDYNGASIIANLRAITNPLVKAISLNESGRSGHNNLFRSEAALRYIDEINVIYRELYNSHNKNIPYEVKQGFYATVDRALAQDIHRGLMDEINAFFLECVKP